MKQNPGTFKDRLLVDFDPHLVLEGIAIACWACKLDHAYFFIRGEYPSQAITMQRAIDEVAKMGVFGGNAQGACDFQSRLHAAPAAGAYICGEETGLLEAIEGRRGMAAIEALPWWSKVSLGVPPSSTTWKHWPPSRPHHGKGCGLEQQGIGVESSIGGPLS